MIGASLGGLDAVCEITADLPADLPAALLVVLHTYASSPRVVADLAQRCSPLAAVYAEDGFEIQAGQVYFAPPDRHLSVAPPGVCRLSGGPKVGHHRPAADVLFESAAHTFGPRVIGMVLTGGDGDGTIGARAIKASGGVMIVQDPIEARAPGMPVHAIKDDHPDFVVSLIDMPALLLRLTSRTA